MKKENTTNLQEAISEVNTACKKCQQTTSKIINDFDLALERILKVFKKAQQLKEHLMTLEEEKAYRKGLAEGAMTLAKICSIFENGSFDELKGLLEYVDKANVKIDKEKANKLIH